MAFSVPSFVGSHQIRSSPKKDNWVGCKIYLMASIGRNLLVSPSYIELIFTYKRGEVVPFKMDFVNSMQLSLMIAGVADHHRIIILL